MYTQLSRKWQSLKIIKVIDNLINSLFSAGNEDSRKIRAIKCILNENNARYCRNHMDLNDQQSTFFMLRIFEIKKTYFGVSLHKSLRDS